MRQLPFILVLLLSGGLLLWNFLSYDTVRAAERDEDVSRLSEVADESLTSVGLVPNTKAPSATGVPGSSPVERLGDEPVSHAAHRVALVADESPAEIDESGADTGAEETTPIPTDAEVENVVERTPEGLVRAEGLKVAGQKHGFWREWWGPNRPMSEGRYVMGRREGPWVYWHENGEIKEHGAFRGDLPHGQWNWSYENGEPRMAMSYAEGQSHGYSQEWGPEGRTVREGNYVEGQPDGRWFEAHPDGSPRSETHYADGVRHGMHRAWFTDGQLMEHGEYSAGLREGRWEFFDSHGRRNDLRSGYYELGRRRNP